MALSKEREKEKQENELRELAEKSKAITKFLKDNSLCQEDTGISDNWSWVFSFMHAGALVKHSKDLTKLTIALYLTSATLIILAFIELCERLFG